MQFMHIRNFNAAVTDRNPRGLSNFGGATIAYEITDIGCFVAVARCHPNDNFCRAKGRAIAGGKIRSEKHTHQIVCYEVETVRDCITRWFHETFREEQ